MTATEFARLRSSTNKEAACHWVCDRADDILDSSNPDSISEQLLTVVCVETFFGEVCNGGFVQWLDNNHGRIAHCCPGALRRVGLPQYAELAAQALRIHHPEPMPESIAAWEPALECIRDVHNSQDYSSLETAFFEFYHANCEEFRNRLFDYIVTHESEFISQPRVA